MDKAFSGEVVNQHEKLFLKGSLDWMGWQVPAAHAKS